jgi:hypothetical protein
MHVLIGCPAQPCVQLFRTRFLYMPSRVRGPHRKKFRVTVPRAARISVVSRGKLSLQNLTRDTSMATASSDRDALLTAVMNALSPRGTAKEMMERIFENKDTIINMLALDRTTILKAPTDTGELVEDEEVDPLMCSSVRRAPTRPRPTRSIIKCDGEHETEVGVHLGCMDPPLDSLPEDEWFCKECQQKSLYQVEAIVDKRDKMKRLLNGQRTMTLAVPPAPLACSPRRASCPGPVYTLYLFSSANQLSYSCTPCMMSIMNPVHSTGPRISPSRGLLSPVSAAQHTLSL